MKPETKELLLVWILRLGGVLTVAAFPTALLPPAWMAKIHEALGMGAYPDAAVTDYMARSLSLLYGYHGVLNLIVSTNVRRFRPFVTYLGIMLTTMGPAMLLIDLNAGMPIFWTLAEGPPLTATGLVILWLRGAVPVQEHPDDTCSEG